MRYTVRLDAGTLDPTRFGSRAASLAEMYAMGLPVMPGFAIDALACRRFLETGDLPATMWQETVRMVESIAAATDRPAVFAVRASSVVPMPGLMDTVLNVGVTDDTIAALGAWGDERFAADIRLQAAIDIARTVRRVPAHRIDSAVASAADRERSPAIVLNAAADALRRVIVEETQRPVPADLHGQLQEAIEAVLASWDRAPARRFRTEHDLSHDLGTGVVIHLMAFGSRPGGSGTGVGFSRDPVTGAPIAGGAYGDGIKRPTSQELDPGIASLDDASPAAAAALRSHLAELEQARRRVIRVDFVREGDDVYVLEARDAQLAPAAAVQAVVDMSGEGLITQEEAVLQVNAEHLEGMLHPHLGLHRLPDALAVGAAAAPGSAAGKAVFTPQGAIDAVADGTPAILILREANPDDAEGVLASAGLLTSHGGQTSHGAVVARGRGIPVVTGAVPMVVDADRGVARIGGETIAEGDTLTIDGSSGCVYLGTLPVEPAQPTDALETLLTWADRYRRLQVWANADTPDVAMAARAAGAEGIGLARTEYMFSGERLAVVQQIILGTSPRDRSNALEELERLQIGDFERLLAQCVLTGPGNTIRGGTIEILRSVAAKGLQGLPV